MDIQRVAHSPVGRLVPLRGVDGRSGQTDSHHAHSPDALSDPPTLQTVTWAAIGRASRALGRLSQAARQVPSPALLRRPTLTREAQSTSALEGTYAPIADVLAGEAEDEGVPLSGPIREILNYITSAQMGFNLIAERGAISLPMLEELQKALIAGTPSESADTGRIRETPVIIGSPGMAIEEARFIPPPPGLDLRAAVTDLVDWMNEVRDERDPVVAAALAHYQFEALHPFHDGNGRIGRLLVVMHLMVNGTLGEPLLSISPWFEARRDEYTHRLAEVSASGDWDGWVSFFARGLAASSEDTAHRVDRLLDLQTSFRDQVRADGARGVIEDVVDNLIGRPYLRVSREARRTGKTTQAIYNVVERLVRLGILVEVSHRSYDRMWVAPRVVQVIQAPSAVQSGG